MRLLKHIQLALLLFSLPLEAQNELLFELEIVGIAGKGNSAPFWHISNHQGIPSINNDNGDLHFAAWGNIFHPNGFGMDYGLDVGLGIGLQSNLFLHQLFVDIDYKCIGVEIGMKERWSDKNRYLSSGSLTWSGNSRPIPEIRAGIPNYTRLSILGRWFSVKGHIGYGRLTDDVWRRQHGNGTYTDGILFHSKSAFLRFGDEERFPLQVTVGLEMNNLFGGIRHSGNNDRIMPSDAAAYWTALFPFNHIEQQGSDDGDNLGSWHLNFDYKCSDWHIGAYYEHFYEDHSSMLGIEYKNNTQGQKDFIFYGFRCNWFDGLLGIEINAPEEIPFFRDVVVEFLNTRGQSGPICHSVAHTTPAEGMAVIEEVDGRDGMYNHSIYDSYSHYGYAIGNPVLISPAYNDDNSARFRSNRVQMFHIGIDGGITNKIDYRFLATSTQHWGCYGAPLKEVERVTSVMLECTYCHGGAYDWKFSISGAMDFDSGSGGSHLLGNNKGVMLTISKSWKVL